MIEAETGFLSAFLCYGSERTKASMPGVSPFRQGAEAAARLEKHGPNALRQAKKRTIWQMYLAQLKDVMVLVLLAAALISGVLLGEWVDAGIILLVVLLNALLGVIQENRAEKSLEALKKLSSPHAKVRRDGEISSVPAADLVPGDVVLLENQSSNFMAMMMGG